jgi:hypothetical protein
MCCNAACTAYTHPSFFVESSFVVLNIPGVTPRIKTHHLGPSIDWSIKIVQQPEWVL